MRSRRRHERLGDLVGTPLLLGPQERLMVNRVGDAVQLVRFGPDFRALAEPVPPEDAADVDGWVRAAERIWGLSGYIWEFQERGRGMEPPMDADQRG